MRTKLFQWQGGIVRLRYQYWLHFSGHTPPCKTEIETEDATDGIDLLLANQAQ